ncbi:MAG: hypothetical protein KGZ30_03620 [Anaplasmataceae bacterium]|nr:hypothetical protein [Anaplasmataceae bacterium]
MSIETPPTFHGEQEPGEDLDSTEVEPTPKETGTTLDRMESAKVYTSSELLSLRIPGVSEASNLDELRQALENYGPIPGSNGATYSPYEAMRRVEVGLEQANLGAVPTVLREKAASLLIAKTQERLAANRGTSINEPSLSRPQETPQPIFDTAREDAENEQARLEEDVRGGLYDNTLGSRAKRWWRNLTS